MSTDTQAGGAGGQDTLPGGAGNGGAGGQGGGGEPWYGALGLDADTATFIAGKGFASAADAFKAHIHADKLARERNVLPMPDVNNIAGWAGWENLGWTPDAAKYAVDLPETAKDLGDLAEGYKGFHEHLVKQLHGQRVPLSAAKQIASEIVAFNVAGLREADAAMARERTELENGLKREWGGAFDANKELASRAIRSFIGADEALAGKLDALMGSADMVRLFHKIGQAMGEDRLVTSKGGAPNGSIADARAQKAALEADPAKMAALRDAAHPQHAAVKAERERLQKIIFADAA